MESRSDRCRGGVIAALGLCVPCTCLLELLQDVDTQRIECIIHGIRKLSNSNNTDAIYKDKILKTYAIMH